MQESGMASRLKKPTLAAAEVEAFATQAPPATKKRSGLVPQGDVRLTVNIRADLHKRLKHAAIDKGLTVGELVEQLAETL